MLFAPVNLFCYLELYGFSRLKGDGRGLNGDPADIRVLSPGVCHNKMDLPAGREHLAALVSHDIELVARMRLKLLAFDLPDNAARFPRGGQLFGAFVTSLAVNNVSGRAGNFRP